MKLKSISTILISTGLSFLYSFLLITKFKIESVAWWESIVFFVVQFIILNLVYFIKADGKKYAGILLVTIVVKFLVALSMIIVYLFTLKGGFYTFLPHFIGHYILFTVFEMRYLLQLIKTRQNEN